MLYRFGSVISNIFTKVLSIKTQAMLLFASAIWMCIGENLKNYRYLAILIMFLSVFIMFKLNKIYGTLWLFLIISFIYINDVFGLTIINKDDMLEVIDDTTGAATDTATTTVEERT